MKSAFVQFLGGGIQLSLVVLLISCDSRVTKHQLLSDEAEQVLLAYGEVYSRLKLSADGTVSNVVNQIYDEKGTNYLMCPFHHAFYVINMDTLKWRGKSAYSNEVAVYCPERHHGLFLVARFNGSVSPAEEKPKFNRP